MRTCGFCSRIGESWPPDTTGASSGFQCRSVVSRISICGCWPTRWPLMPQQSPLMHPHSQPHLGAASCPRSRPLVNNGPIARLTRLATVVSALAGKPVLQAPRFLLWGSSTVARPGRSKVETLDQTSHLLVTALQSGCHAANSTSPDFPQDSPSAEMQEKWSTSTPPVSRSPCRSRQRKE